MLSDVWVQRAINKRHFSAFFLITFDVFKVEYSAIEKRRSNMKLRLMVGCGRLKRTIDKPH